MKIQKGFDISKPLFNGTKMASFGKVVLFFVHPALEGRHIGALGEMQMHHKSSKKGLGRDKSSLSLNESRNRKRKRLSRRKGVELDLSFVAQC